MGPEDIRRIARRRREHAAAHRRRTGGVAVGSSKSRRAGRRTAAVQRRTGAVRLRRLARSAGAAAQGRLVLPAAREAVRRQTRRARHRVHRLRRRRRQAHAGADQRPAHVLPGRPAQRHRRPTSTSTRRWIRALANLSTAIEESGRGDHQAGGPLPQSTATRRCWRCCGRT